MKPKSRFLGLVGLSRGSRRSLASSDSDGHLQEPQQASTNSSFVPPERRLVVSLRPVSRGENVRRLTDLHMLFLTINIYRAPSFPLFRRQPALTTF
jgi:hypothetical protein